MKQLTWLVPAVLVVVACSGTDHVIGGDSHLTSTGGSAGAAGGGTGGAGGSGGTGGSTQASDAFSVLSLGTSGSTLNIEVGYSCGCAEHTFDATWDGGLTKSVPPQAAVEVHHDAHGDSCEAYCTKVIPFDASELLSTGRVLVHVESSPAGNGKSLLIGSAGNTCTDPTYSTWTDHLCGGGDGYGQETCASPPTPCPAPGSGESPICGCDGQVHANACDLGNAGVDQADDGRCATPAGMFPCLGIFCAAGTEYCRITMNDVSGYAHYASCLPLDLPLCDPGPGGDACDCISGLGAPPLCSCAVGEQASVVTVTCPGG